MAQETPPRQVKFRMDSVEADRLDNVLNTIRVSQQAMLHTLVCAFVEAPVDTQAEIARRITATGIEGAAASIADALNTLVVPPESPYGDLYIDAHDDSEVTE